MAINIFLWSDRIPLTDLGLDLKDRPGRARLASRIRSLLTGTPSAQVLPTPANLQQYIDLYGEQVTVDASADIDKYFRNLNRRGITFGGLPTGLGPLAIATNDIRPSTTAVSMIGEGLVGWYMQQQGFLPFRRPIGEGPDFIFLDPTTIPPRTVLVEVKSTQGPDVRGQLRDTASPSLQYAHNIATPRNDVSCFLVGVIIQGGGDYDLLSLGIELY